MCRAEGKESEKKAMQKKAGPKNKFDNISKPYPAIELIFSSKILVKVLSNKY